MCGFLYTEGRDGNWHTHFGNLNHLINTHNSTPWYIAKQLVYTLPNNSIPQYIPKETPAHVH